MTNYEKYKEVIRRIYRESCDTGLGVAVTFDGVPQPCSQTHCNDCIVCLSDEDIRCEERIIEWAASEYKGLGDSECEETDEDEHIYISEDEINFCKFVKHGWIYRHYDVSTKQEDLLWLSAEPTLDTSNDDIRIIFLNDDAIPPWSDIAFTFLERNGLLNVENILELVRK